MKSKFVWLAALLALLLAVGGIASAEAYDGQATVGMLEDAAMHSLVVHVDGGATVAFAMDDDTEVDAPEGLLIGERVVVYSDDDFGDTPVASKVVVLSSITGKVVDATMHGVTIEDDEGHKYHFNEDDDTQTIAVKGVTIGAHLEIAYEGAMAFAVEDQDVKVWEVFAGTSVTGEIEGVDADTETVDVEVHGITYTFSTANAPIDGEGHMRRGNTATVKFYGALDAEAALQQVRVAQIVVKAAAAPAPTPTPEPQKHSLEGTVQDASIHTITVKTAKHNLYTFEKRDSTRIKGKTGISIGDTVKISYTGSLNSHKDVQPVKVSQIAILKHKSHEEHEPAAEEAIMGVVKDATMHTVTIKADHKKYIFELTDETRLDLPDGLNVGETVKIYYKGKLHHTKKVQSAKVTRIVEKDD